MLFLTAPKKTLIDNVILEKVNLEDTEFNKKFEVYSQDQIEGRCATTPAFMERLLNLKTVFGAKNIKCSFFDNKSSLNASKMSRNRNTQTLLIKFQNTQKRNNGAQKRSMWS